MTAAALCGVLAMPAKAQQLLEAQQFTPGQAVLAPFAVSPVVLQNLTPVQASGLSLSGLFEQDPTVQNLNKVQAQEQANYTDAYYAAYDQFCNDTFTYISRAPENAIFEGYYSPSANSQIFLYTPNGVGLTLQDIADILRPIYVYHYNGGTSYHTGITQGSNIYNIPATLQAGHTYSVHLEVDSRTTFNPAQVNGASLFTYAVVTEPAPQGNITVTVTNQGPSPVTTSVGVPTSIPLEGTIAGTDGAGNVCRFPVNQWHWNVESVQYSASSADDAKKPDAPKSKNTSVPYFDPSTGSTNPMDTTLHIVFTKAGYYSVTVKANDQYQSDICGNGTKEGTLAIPVTVQASDGMLHVYFDRPLLKVGTGTKTSVRDVRAYITPSSMADSISFQTTNTTEAEVVKDSRADEVKGDVTFVTLSLKGKAGTPSSTPNGDNQLSATAGGQSVATVPVIVYVPTRIGIPHPHPSSVVAGVNQALDAGSKPAALGLDKNEVLLATGYYQPLAIIVWDQFDKLLDSIYVDTIVAEYKEGKWGDINSNMRSDGTYVDYVGFTQPNPPPGDIVRNDDAPNSDKTKWLKGTTKASLTDKDNTPPPLSVQVDGVTLKVGIVGREKIYDASTSTLTIKWPDK